MPEPDPSPGRPTLAEVLESIADPIVAFDKQWHFTFVSRRAAESLGKSSEELLGKSIWDLFPADRDTGFEDACRQAWRDGRPVIVERYSNVLGAWLENYIYPFADGASAQWRDITARKHAEQKLKESEALLRGFFDSPGVMRGIVAIIGGVITHESCNSAAADMYGVDCDSIAGRSAGELDLSPEVARLWNGIYAESRRTGRPISMEYSRRDAEGNELWLLATAAYLGVGQSGHPRFAYTVIDLTGRKRIEQALREREAMLRALGDNLPEAAIYRYRLDAGGHPHFDFISAGIERLTGAPPSEYMNDASAGERYVVPEDRERLRAAIEASRENLSRFEIEVRHRHRVTGEITWSLMRSTPTRNPDGSIAWDGIELDITKRKQFENELRETQEHLRQRVEELETIMNVAPVAIWVAHDPECRDITGNPMANAFYEAETGENVSATTAGVIRRFFSNGLELKPEELPIQQAAARNIDIRGAEMEVLLPSGKMFSMLGHASPLRDASGRVRGAVGAFLDITARKRAEEELKSFNELIKLAHKAANAGTWRLDLQTGELFWTEECYKLFGLDPSAKPTREFFYSLVHPEDRERIIPSLELALREHRREIRDDYRVIKQDGYHWFERRAAIIYGRNGLPAQFVGISSDITERKRLEMSLRQSNDDLQRFAYIASHDLQEPLRNIAGMTSLLLRLNEGRLAPESQQVANLIARGVRTMNDLIESLLEFSRVTNDKDPCRPVDLTQVLATALDHLSEPIRKTGAQVSAPPLPTVRGNPGLLVRVFQNLLGNAIKYQVPGVTPRITISVNDRTDDWLFSIRDNGIGFDLKYQDQIFVAFKRLHPNSSEYGGTGIGLAIVKRIIDQHGGQVCADSQPGQGSTFYFTLPKSPA